MKHFPVQMRKFDRQMRKRIILDDVRAFQFLKDHRDKLQGKYDTRVEFASTPGGRCAYSRWLFQVPFIVTVAKLQDCVPAPFGQSVGRVAPTLACPQGGVTKRDEVRVNYP